MDIFWYQLIQVHLEMAVKTERKRKREFDTVATLLKIETESLGRSSHWQNQSNGYQTFRV